MPDQFTPEQIAQILEEFFKVVGTRQYIGARYVPLFGRKDEESIEWDNTGEYEPLTIVLYQGNSYTSRQFVPVGVEITNQEFWAITGNYNAQVEQYRRETAAVREVADAALLAANNAQTDIDTLLPKADFSSENTVKQYVDDSVAEVQTDIDTLLPKADFSAENTVKKYVDDSIENTVDTMIERLSGKLSIVDSYADLAATTDDYVLVLHNDSPYGDGHYCFFEKTTFTGGATERTDGTYVMAMPNQQAASSTQAPMYDIMNCAATYINNDNLVYGTEHTLFHNTVTNQIDCSAFVQACLEGITYQKSRYVRGTLQDNVPSNYIGEYVPHDIAGTDGRVPTWLMARWYMEHKNFYKFTGDADRDISELRAGDILFSTTMEYEAQNRIYNIDHCMLVVNVFQNDGAVLIAQCGGAVSTMTNMQTTVGKLTLIDFRNWVNREDGRGYVGFARPNYGNGCVSGNAITGMFTSAGSVSVLEETTSVTLGRITVDTPLEQNKIYTLALKGKLPKYDYDGCWLVATDIRSNNDARLYHISNWDDGAIFTFMVPEIADSTDKLYYLNIRAILDSKTEYASSFNLEQANLYDGFSCGGSTYKAVKFTSNPNLDSVVTELALSFCVDANNRLVCTGSGTLTSAPAGDYLLGSIDADYAPSETQYTILPYKTSSFVVLSIDGNGSVRVTPNTQISGASKFRVNHTFLPFSNARW